MKIALRVKGRQIEFSESEIKSILQKYVFTEKIVEPEQDIISEKVERTEVNPRTINRRLFEEKRGDLKQERTRKIIAEAFAESDANPSKYNHVFNTLIPIPEKTWFELSGEELQNLAIRFGDHQADWIEQAFEWAQQISNGNGNDKAWRAICNDADETDYYRLIKWKDGFYRIVGGAHKYNINTPASDVVDLNFILSDVISFTVPLVVRYK